MTRDVFSRSANDRRTMRISTFFRGRENEPFLCSNTFLLTKTIVVVAYCVMGAATEAEAFSF